MDGPPGMRETCLALLLQNVISSGIEAIRDAVREAPSRRAGDAVKLIIQIPCYNEEETLPETLADLPDSVPGVDEIEVLVINDGSVDSTVQVAREHGVHHVLDLGHNRGLAYAWSAGLDAALRAGADVIVNTDGDNQYSGADIEKLVRPILRGECDIVIGCRPIEEIEHFSWLKKRLQRFGSWVVSKFAGACVSDATSGFRAYSREAAFMLNVASQYTYSVETIIRAARKGIRIVGVPIRVNRKLRESRLMSSMSHYMWRQAGTIFRVFTMVKPLRVFLLAASILLLGGLAGCARFLYFYFTTKGMGAGRGAGHIQSLLLSAALVIVAFVVGMIGLAADMISRNRELIEDSLYRLKKLEIEGGAAFPARDKEDSQRGAGADAQ